MCWSLCICIPSPVQRQGFQVSDEEQDIVTRWCMTCAMMIEYIYWSLNRGQVLIKSVSYGLLTQVLLIPILPLRKLRLRKDRIFTWNVRISIQGVVTLSHSNILPPQITKDLVCLHQPFEFISEVVEMREGGDGHICHYGDKKVSMEALKGHLH